MAKKVTTVKSYPKRVAISLKNPKGVTIVDKHLRHFDGASLNRKQIKNIVSNYSLSKLIYPSVNNLNFSQKKQYDTLIAIWCDFFNKQFPNKARLDPNILKALIASETGFRENPQENKGLSKQQI